jgi:hypothetical protein
VARRAAFVSEPAKAAPTVLAVRLGLTFEGEGLAEGWRGPALDKIVATVEEKGLRVVNAHR